MENKNLEILKDFIKDAEQYKSWQGKLCFRQFGTFAYYNLLCAKLHLNIQCINAYNYTAKNDFLELEYCEQDIILTFNLLSRDEIDGGLLDFTLARPSGQKWLMMQILSLTSKE